MGKPSNLLFINAEKPPKNKPFERAYKGVVTGAQCFMYEVRILKTIAANSPPDVYQRTSTPW